MVVGLSQNNIRNGKYRSMVEFRRAQSPQSARVVKRRLLRRRYCMQRSRVWRRFGEEMLRQLLHRCQAQRRSWSCTPPNVQSEEFAPNGVRTGLHGIRIMAQIKHTLWKTVSVVVFEMGRGGSLTMLLNMRFASITTKASSKYNK